MPRHVFEEVGDQDMRHSCYALDVAVALYVKEVTEMVWESVIEETQKDIDGRNGHRHDRAMVRRDALRIWTSEPYPLT